MGYLRILGLIVTVCSIKGKKNEIIGKEDIKIVGLISNLMGRKNYFILYLFKHRPHFDIYVLDKCKR